VSTQLPYALTAAAVSFVTYLLAGYIQNAVICLAIGAALTIGLMFLLKKILPENADLNAPLEKYEQELEK
jgi:hypothetical protein